ncbi:hypothetical protein REG_0628 [Candidatus Regiella insecticola LSR1]|uniref:Uncharacterized protein n=1 Tax=Candidatus Regiella insecticola LSR1 TaxID=663321 RepID=E0WRM3_9ENTR|nr:hypothetical protein [Candidatus Regiella insecticola]EFL92783.1 hypothetical protein REG_0628 [Candidatus Regiella insecticola LSR1]
MLQAVEQSGAGMSLSLIEPGKKDAAGYHSIAGWRVMDVPIVIPEVQPLHENNQERYYQPGYLGLEKEEKRALEILQALHPDQDAMTLWRSFNMGGELRQRFRAELMSTGRIPPWAEEHRRTSIDPNNLHIFEHIRQLSNAMLAKLIKYPDLSMSNFSSSDTLIDSFDRAFLRSFTQSRGYQRNAMGALFRTDIRGVFRGDHRTPYELSQDKYMLGFGDNFYTQHTSGNTLYTSSVYQDAFQYGRINPGGASQFHYGYQDDEEYYSFVDSDDSDDERSEPLRQRQRDGFVYLLDTRGLEAIPVADNMLLNPNNTVTNDLVVAGEIHVSVPLEGISFDRIWLVSSDGQRAVRVSDIAQHDDFDNELRDLSERTFAGANSDIYDGIFTRLRGKG